MKSTQLFVPGSNGRVFLRSACLLALLAIGELTSVRAASQTWTGTTDGAWGTGSNWGGSAPGAVSGVANGDTATFNNNVNTAVTVDAYRNIEFLLFDTGAGAFTLSGGQLVLTNAGNITMNAGVTNTETINTNLLLTTTATSAYSFLNNSSTSGAKLNIGGNVTGQTTATPTTLTIGGSNGGTVSGAISNGTAGGTVALTKSGAGTWTLSGANTYTGTTNITAGTLKVGSSTALGASRVNLTAGATIDLNGNNLSVDFLNNGAALAGGVVDNVSAGGNVTLTVGGNQGGVNAASGTYTNIDTFSGIIQNTTGTVALTKVSPSVANQTVGIMATASLLNGPDVLRLTNANTFTGATTIKGGTIELNFNQSNNGGAAITTNIISSSSVLKLAGGELIVDSIGSTGAQTFASVTVDPGASHVGAYRNTSGAASANLQTVTRNTGGTIDFMSRPTGASSNAKIGAADGTITVKTPNANFTGGSATILGGYALYGQTTWAVGASSGTTQTTLSGLGSYSATYAATTNVDSATGTSTPAAMTINSLRFNTVGAYTVNTAGDLTIATGGILVTPTVGANAVAINNNNLTSNNLQDLIVIQGNSSGGMTIGSNITGSIGLTKSGVGTLTLTPNTANTFTGQVTINAGTLLLGNANALNSNGSTYNDVVFGGTTQLLGGSTPSWVIQNGTLTLNGFNATVGSLSSSADSSGTAIVQNANASAKTLTISGSTTASFAGTIQDGTGGGALSVVKAGSGTQTFLNNTYTGNTTVNGGTLVVKNTILGGTAPTVSVAGGATLDVSLVSSGLTLTTGKTLSGTAAVSTTGTVLGAVTLNGGAINTGAVSGLTFGTLAPVSLTLTTGTLNFNITNPSTTTGVSSLINVTGSNGLTINGGTVNLSGATFLTGTPYNITYNLFQFAGSVQGSGISALAVGAGSQVNGLSYLFGTAGSNVTLTISGTPLLVTNWITDGSSSWATSGNWSAGIPNSATDTANLGGSASTHTTLARTVTLDGSKTVGVLGFSSPNGESYTLAQGSGGSLILDNGGSAASISTSGTHLIDATVLVNLSSNLTVGTTVGGDTLTIAGVISNTSGSKTLTKTGPGTLILTNANTYGPAAGTVGTNLNGGIIEVQTNTSLGAGDVSFGSIATLRAGAAGLTLANNIAIGAGISATVDTKGNIFTLPGVISGATGALTLASSTGNGTVILTNSSPNTYGGGTTINASTTLQVGNSTATGSLPTTGAITDNGSLVFKRSDAGTIAVGNAISGSGGVTQNGASGSVLQMNGNNSYTGATTVTTGTVELGNNNGIGSGDLSLATSIDLKTFSPTIGALSGAGTIDSSSVGAKTVSIGNNGNSGSFSGLIQNTAGTINLVKNGAGTQTLGGANTYTGTTALNAGTLTLTNSLGSSGTPTGAITTAAGTLNISGATIYAPSLGVNNGGSVVNLVGGGAVTLSGTLAVNSVNGGGATNGLLSLTNGTISANAVTIGRSGENYGTTVQLAGSTANGIYLNGGSLTIANTLALGTNASTLSSPTMRMDSGSVTVGGTTTITDNNSRYGLLDIAGGTFTSNDTVGAGIQVGGVHAAGYGELLVRGGILNTNKITMGSAGQTGGSDYFLAIGGTTYLGSGGIVSGGTTGAFTIALGNNTVTTAPTIAASADWASSLPMTLTNSSSAATPIFKAADASNVAHNIALSGALSGAGGLTKTGGGTLTLSVANGYLGGTNINAGTLAIADAAALGTSGTISFGGGALQYNGINTDLSGRFSQAASQAYSVNTNGQNVTWATALTSSGGTLAKSGGGTLTLTAANSYTGATTVNAGTLALSGSGAVAGNVSVSSGATFDTTALSGYTVGSSKTFTNNGTLNVGSANTLTVNGTLGGSGSVTGNVAISGTGALAPGNSPGLMTITGDLSLAGATNMEITTGVTPPRTAGTDYDQVAITGTHAISLGGALNLYFSGTPTNTSYGTYDLFNWGSNTPTGAFTSINFYYNNVPQTPTTIASVGQTWTATIGTLNYSFNGGSGDLTVVPEPGQYGVMVGLGLAALVVVRRRRRRA